MCEAESIKWRTKLQAENTQRHNERMNGTRKLMGDDFSIGISIFACFRCSSFQSNRSYFLEEQTPHRPIILCKQEAKIFRCIGAFVIAEFWVCSTHNLTLSPPHMIHPLHSPFLGKNFSKRCDERWKNASVLVASAQSTWHTLIACIWCCHCGND